MKRNTRLALSILAGAIIIAAIGIYAASRMGFLGPTGSTAQMQTGHAPQIRGQAYGAWVLTCGNTAQTANRCALIMRAIEQKTGRVVVSIIVTRGPKGNPVLATNVPPTAVAQAGVIIRPGNAQPMRNGFQTCNQRLCQALFLLDENLYKELAASGQIGVRFMLPGNHPMGLRLPTKGFQEAFNAWNAKSPGAPPPAAQAAQAAPGTQAPAAPAHN